jgi:ribosomal RNA assembly protein
MKYLKIPMKRIGVLIGHDGETRKKIEQISKVKLEIDSKLGEILIDDSKIEDPLLTIKIENIVLAIGRGFSPENAFLLLNDDYEFFIFDIRDYVGNKINHIIRLKSRIIGKNGKTKKVLENLTNSFISVHGHTISIISSYDNIDILKKAIDKLLTGSKHATTYRYIESNMKKKRKGLL